MSPLIPLLLFAEIGALAIGGITLVKQLAQLEADHRRRHYLISFPRDVSFDSVLAFVRSLSGLLTPALARFGGVLTVVFEVEADQRGIRYRIAVPYQAADFVVGQARTLIPGVHVELADAVHHEAWREAIELTLTSSDRPLRIPSPEAVVNTLLSSFSPLKEKEGLLMQIVAAPAFAEAPSSKDKLHAKKHEDHTFMAVTRLAARAETSAEAKRLMRRLYTGLSSVKAYGVSFRYKRVLKGSLHGRLRQRNASLVFPCLLNAPELATLIAFPVGKPNVPGLPQGRSRHLAADPSIPSDGLLLAHSNFPGAERPLAMSALDRTKHLHILGPTGTGKSSLILNLAVQEMQAGYGIVVIEPKGDLIADIADRVPRDRINDVILLDATDSERPIGFNVLGGADPYLVTDQVLGVFDKLFNVLSLARTSDVIRSGVLTLAQSGLTLMDLPALLGTSEASKDFRSVITRKLSDRALRNFWDAYDALKQSAQEEAIAPVMRRLRPFELRPSLRGMLGQVESGFDLKDVLATNKILLVSLSKGQLGEETSGLLGSLVMMRLWQEVQGRSAIPIADRKPFFAHIDEFQNYLNLPMSVTDILAEARGYGFGLTLSHQNLGQLPPNLRDAVLANARSKVVFQAAASDAMALAREFSPYLDAGDLQNLGPHEVIVRLATGGQMAPPATATTSPPPPPAGTARAVRAASRARYGRSALEVEAELAARHQVFGRRPRPKPEIGRVDE